MRLLIDEHLSQQPHIAAVTSSVFRAGLAQMLAAASGNRPLTSSAYPLMCDLGGSIADARRLSAALPAAATVPGVTVAVCFAPEEGCAAVAVGAIDLKGVAKTIASSHWPFRVARSPI